MKLPIVQSGAAWLRIAPGVVWRISTYPANDNRWPWKLGRAPWTTIITP